MREWSRAGPRVTFASGPGSKTGVPLRARKAYSTWRRKRVALAAAVLDPMQAEHVLDPPMLEHGARLGMEALGGPEPDPSRVLQVLADRKGGDRLERC